MKISTLQMPLQSSNPWARTLRTLLRNRMAVIGISVILAWAIIAIFAPWITPYGPFEQNINDRLIGPTASHLFGTDELGRDVFTRVLYGSRISLPVGLIVISISMAIGTLVGATAGYLGGIFDLVAMRMADITLAFPSIVLALAIAAVLGPGLTNAVIAMAVVSWPEYARLMRGQVLGIRNNEYVFAAEMIGASRSRILFRHILPNAFGPILVKASLDAGSSILNIAALSFIGLGAIPPTPEWGAMISVGRFKFYSWWLTTFPGLAILSVVLGFNFFGDGVRDAFDPKIVTREG